MEGLEGSALVALVLRELERNGAIFISEGFDISSDSGENQQLPCERRNIIIAAVCKQNIHVCKFHRLTTQRETKMMHKQAAA